MQQLAYTASALVDRFLPIAVEFSGSGGRASPLLRSFFDDAAFWVAFPAKIQQFNVLSTEKLHDRRQDQDNVGNF